MVNAHYPIEVRNVLRALDAVHAKVAESHSDAYEADNSVALAAAVGDLIAALGGAYETAETLVGDGSSTWEADDEVITEATHGLAVGDYVRVSISSGATGASSGYFYVKTVPSSSTFTLSTTSDGATQAISADGVVNVYKVTGGVAGAVGVRIAEAVANNIDELASSGAITLAIANRT